MKEKDLILNSCLQIKLMLQDVMEDENGCNEGLLSMHYDKIMELLTSIEKERLLCLYFWGDDYD